MMPQEPSAHIKDLKSNIDIGAYEVVSDDECCLRSGWILCRFHTCIVRSEPLHDIEMQRNGWRIVQNIPRTELLMCVTFGQFG